MTILGHTIIGNGKKHIIVLHELMGDSKNYDPIHPYIDTANFTYYFVDHRGYGKSKTLTGEYSCQEAAQDVINLITYLALKEVNLVAHSMSTMIAQKIALLDEHIRQLILITPLSASGIKMKTPAKEKLLDSVKKNENFVENVVKSSSKRYNDTWRTYRIKMGYNASTVEARYGYMNMYLTTDFIEEVKNITIPIHIVVGRNDLPAFNKLTIKKLFENNYNNFDITECMEAGHYPMVEAPVYFATTIENFVTKLH